MPDSLTIKEKIVDVDAMIKPYEDSLKPKPKPITKEDIKKIIGKNPKSKSQIKGWLKKLIVSKPIIKTSPQGSVVFKKEEPHSKYFKREWERAKWV